MRPADDGGPAALFSRFSRAYRRAVDAWPVPVTSAAVPTGYGRTHVLFCGEDTAPPVLLLPGHGATAAVWGAVAAGLSPRHRVIAVDPPGQPAPGQPPTGQPVSTDRRPVRATADLTDWLDQLLDALSVPRAAVIGHSYGAYLAVQYALHAPGRVSRLVLLDPTDTFAPLGLGYRLRAVPALARPSGAGMRRFLAWETRGLPVDETWLDVVAAGQDLGRAKIVMPRRPRADQITGLDVPVLVIVAGRSRAHDPSRIIARARELLPEATTATLDRATHHTIPAGGAAELLGHIEPFLG